MHVGKGPGVGDAGISWHRKAAQTLYLRRRVPEWSSELLH